MLQFSGFGDAYSDFQDCVRDHGADDPVCAEIYNQSVPSDQSQKMTACSVCDPHTQWCDDGRCVPFSAAEQAQWASAGKPPTQVATSATPSIISGISNKALVAIGGIVLVGLLIFKRS